MIDVIISEEKQGEKTVFTATDGLYTTHLSTKDNLNDHQKEHVFRHMKRVIYQQYCPKMFDCPFIKSDVIK